MRAPIQLRRRCRPAWLSAWVTAWAIVALLVLQPLLHAGSETPQRPNILFLFADDLSYEMVHALGNERIRTPHLDQLASEGMVFTQAFNMGSWSGAVCIASRTMLNTGRFVWRAEKVDRTCERERQEGRFWSEYLRAAGYETYMSGKWHVKANAQLAFNHTAHIRPGMPKDTPEGYNRPIEGQPDPWSPYDPKFGGFWEGGRHWSEVLADDAEKFLRQAAGSSKPFFMYLAFNASHDPRQPPKEYVDLYPPETMPLPRNFLSEYPYQNSIGCGPSLRDERLAPFPRTPYAVRVHRQEYHAITTHMDAQIGRILQTLRDTGQDRNTWIFFTADHGLAVGHHGLMGKQNQYEHSIRVPLFVVGPGVPKGIRIDAPVYLQDIMPTTLELAGVTPGDHVEFHSLMPFIRGERRDSFYPEIYGAYLKLQRMIRAGDWKLILYPSISKARLYNLREDPDEMRDLADAPSQRPRIKRLFARFLELAKEVDDPLDLTTAFPDLAP